jgi:D-alanyl-D-alanine carboxypeptidase
LVANDPGGLGILNSNVSYLDSANNDNGEVVTTPAYANATTFTITGLYSSNVSATNASGGTYVSYLFASCPGVSKVGIYVGTGTTQTINCGFTGGARFVMIKRTDSTGDWYVWDTARGMIPANDPYLLLNSTAAEVTGTDFVDTTSVGFEITSTAPAAINASGGTFIFLAIA